MNKKNMLSLFLVLVVIFIFIVLLFIGNPNKDIDVKILDIYDQNNQYFINVSIKNNQDKIGWIGNIFLSTVQGSTIDLTGAGAGFKIESGKTINLILMSEEVDEGLIEAPYTLSYTTYPRGNEYTIYI